MNRRPQRKQPTHDAGLSLDLFDAGRSAVFSREPGDAAGERESESGSRHGEVGSQG